jgi:glycosyltransferase involved in cell wall biosynthesis
MARPAVITSHPLLAGFSPLEWAHSVTYYALDDYAAHPAYRLYDPSYEAAYDGMRARHARVCAVSKPLLEKLAPAGLAAVVPNAVEPDEWLDPSPPPAWFERLSRPRIVYAGVLEVRVDWRMIDQLALHLPRASIVLAGQRPNPDEPIPDRPNVHVVPQLNRADVVGIIAGADACIVPHTRTRMTEAMSPLKLYEYLAGGRPVIATNIPPMREVSPWVHLARTPQEFVDQADAALAMGPMPDQTRRKFIAANSWGQRHDDILALALR